MKQAIFLLLIAGPQYLWACSQKFSLPIDVNNYYSGSEGLTGDSLKAQLKNIVDGHTNYGYGCVWSILELADADPSNANNVIGFYTRRSIPIVDRDYGSNTPNAWNREHIWAKSHGIGNSDKPAYSDAHHLRATDKSVNADRASKDFANGGTQHSECSACSYTSNSWEPPDEVKGDTARMMFYMATRYEGIDSGGDLELQDSTGTSSPYHGDLCDMMQWHLNDPVSSEELQRNDIVYSFQGNRNPFIDFPAFAIAIWGEQCGLVVPPISSQENDEDIPFLPWWALLTLPAIFIGLINKIKTN